jgi:hypothetical protein
VGALTTLGVLTCLGAAATARAQDPEPTPVHKWDLKAGIFLPTQGALRNQSGSPYINIGVDYNPNFRYKPAGGQVYFNVDFKFRESGGLSYLTIPLTANVVWNFTPIGSQYRVYGGIGAGVYFINTGFIGGTTQGGVRFIVGADITEKYFLELDYDYTGGFTDSRGNGLRVDGLTFSVGRRF